MIPSPNDLYDILCRDYDVDEIIKYESREEAIADVRFVMNMFPAYSYEYVFISDNIVGWIWPLDVLFGLEEENDYD